MGPLRGFETMIRSVTQQAPSDSCVLKIRQIPIDTYPENTAFLLRQGNGYSAEQFQALRKIRVSGAACEILATLALVDDPAMLQETEIGLGEQAFRRLGLPEGAQVAIQQAKPPTSLEYVRRKIDGDTLQDDEIGAIIADIAAHRYSPMEIGAYLVACAGFMSTQETLATTSAMAAIGNRLQWDKPLVVDKHCIGGVPGNRTSMIVVPIVAAHGLLIPKTSSRAITSPSGTADTMEVLAKVDLSESQIREIVAREGAVLAWGGRMNLSPADDILISVERPLRIDTFEQMVASILSKKLAAGSTSLVLDIPVGPSAKVRTRQEAMRLRKLFQYVAGKLGLTLEVVLTDGSQPVGNGIGPVLEARDVMAVLRNDADAPQDLRERALLLAGHVLELDPELEGGRGFERALELLNSGKALEAMNCLIFAQGAQDQEYLPGAYVHEIRAPCSGWISAIDCHRIARIARLAGAPMDKGAGIYLLHKVGSHIGANEPLYRIHAASETGLGYAVELAADDSGFKVAP